MRTTVLRIAAALLLAGAMLAHPARAGEESGLAGDPERGADIYDRCIACHSLERDRTGPRHCGLLGRKAGGVQGFRYSRAMERFGVVWSWETLDRFLENPRKTVPGTSMGYAGVKDAKERRDLIAYLEKAGADPELCPQP